MKEVPMQFVPGAKLPSNIATVCTEEKMVARELSETSWFADGGGAAVKLHHSRNEKGVAGL